MRTKYIKRIFPWHVFLSSLPCILLDISLICPYSIYILVDCSLSLWEWKKLCVLYYHSLLFSEIFLLFLGSLKVPFISTTQLSKLREHGNVYYNNFVWRYCLFTLHGIYEFPERGMMYQSSMCNELLAIHILKRCTFIKWILSKIYDASEGKNCTGHCT